MEYAQTVYASWLSNYEEFYQEPGGESPGFLTDCCIHVLPALGAPPSEIVPAHRVILSNSSDFFYNIFTAGMRESETGVVEVVCKPPALFRSIVRWMYTGTFEYAPCDIAGLLQVAHGYGIVQLERFLRAQLGEFVTPATVIAFLDRCFEDQLPDAAAALEPFLARFLRELDARELGRSCDVQTFVRALAQCPMANKERVALITQFVDADTGYELTAEDRLRLTQCLNRAEPLKPFLSEDMKWLRKGFYQSLKN
jgi:hypothetical protein